MPNKLMTKIAVLAAIAIIGLLMAVSCATPATPQVVEKVVTQQVEKVVTAVVTKEVEKMVQVTPVPKVSEAESLRRQTLVMNHRGGGIEMSDWYNPFPTARNMQGTYQLMNEALFYLNYETGKIEPWLASEYKYDANYAGVTIKLNPQAYWNDGKPFTADDVIFTINFLVKNPSFRGGALGVWLKDFTKVDANTVHFTFTQSYPRFIIEQIANTTCNPLLIVPQHIWEGKDPKTFNNYDPAKGLPVWTGPYKLSQSTSSQIVYTLDANWWAAKAGIGTLPAVKRVVMLGVLTEQEKAAKLLLNEVDVEPLIQAATFSAISKNNPKLTAWTKESPFAWSDPNPLYAAINTLRAPWNDAEMRWALMYAVDRQKLVNLSFEGHGALANTFYPDYAPYEQLLAKNKDLFDKYPITTYDPKKAIQIIESKGYKKVGDYYQKDGKTLEINMVTDQPQQASYILAMDQAFEQYFKAVGIKLNVRQVPYSVKIQEGLGDNWDMWIDALQNSPFDPVTALLHFHERYYKPLGEQRTGSHDNPSRWKNSEYSALVDQMSKLEPGDPKAEPLWRQAMEILMKEMPYIPIAQQKYPETHNETYWTGWPTKANNYIQPQSWCAPFNRVIQKLKPANP